MQEGVYESEKQVEERKRIDEKMAKIKRKIMVLSNKGGVGKTTVAVNLATGFALQGLRVGLMDADFHGPNVPKMLGLSGRRMVLNNEEMVPISLSLDGGLLKVVSLAFLADEDSAVIWRGMLKMSVINQFLADVQWGELDYLNEVFLFVFGFVVGFLIEATAVRIGFEHFPDPTLCSVPLWIPLMWGFTFIVIGRVGNKLISRGS